MITLKKEFKTSQIKLNNLGQGETISFINNTDYQLATEYNKWKEQNLSDLQTTFSNYVENGGSWIKQGYREKIQEFLFPTSNEKCAYCERKPNDGGGNLEIEHFYPKKGQGFENKSFDFDNLLPSCKQCNTKKGIKYKIGNIEILNPYKESNISSHLKLNTETLILEGVSEIGKATIKLLESSLNVKKYFDKENNKQKGTLYVRKEIEDQIVEKLENIKETKKDIERNLNNNNLAEIGILKNRLFEKLKTLLRNEIRIENSITATRATIILNHNIFKEVFEYLNLIDNNKYNKIKLIRDEKMQYCL